MVSHDLWRRLGGARDLAGLVRVLAFITAAEPVDAILTPRPAHFSRPGRCTDLTPADVVPLTRSIMALWRTFVPGRSGQAAAGGIFVPAHRRITGAATRRPKPSTALRPLEIPNASFQQQTGAMRGVARLRWTIAGLSAGAAAALSIAIGWRNYFVYRAGGIPVPALESMIGEVPVWFGWVALTPLVIELARWFPLVGGAALRDGSIHLLAALAGSAIVSVFSVLFRMLLPNTPSPATLDIGFWSFTQQVYTSVTFSFLFVYATILGLTVATIYYTEQQQRRIRESQLQALLAETQRDLLRAQMHPHFLFNTLHAISALMGSDVSAARQMLSRLSDLLRLALDEEASAEVPLHRELEFVERYLDIQSIRFRDRLTVRYEVDHDTHRLLVPQILLQPLVENAIIHGLGPVERRVEVSIEARVDGGDLVISVRDNGAGLSPEATDRIGIGNTRARLEYLYGNTSKLSLRALPTGGTEAQIVIPAHSRPVHRIPSESNEDDSSSDR